MASSSSSSSIDPTLPPLHPIFDPTTTPSAPEPPRTQQLIQTLHLQPHPEGGYFAETDRDRRRIPNPFAHHRPPTSSSNILVDTRAAMTTIHYLLTPASPLGAFHRNRARTVHTLHRGRGRYVIIHADDVASTSCPGGYDAAPSPSPSASDDDDAGARRAEERRWTGKARVETFVVGPDVVNGERVQWIVEGGKYKGSFLLGDDETGAETEGGGSGSRSEGLLISETVAPGFEFEDHDFLEAGRLEALVTREQAGELGWMVRRG